MERDWKWWAARSPGDVHVVGPCDTREEVIEQGRDYFDGDPFSICEATQPPVRLSDWIGADDLLERAEDAIHDSDRVHDDFDDAIFEASAAQVADLHERVRKAVDDWQEAHGLTFHANTFADSRSHESIPEAP